mmetsp:Transcript_45539/g.120336  ORF Transcript_45539/g.120336 Transcript_45539/m.120336 type:complete len:482 (-) Transcript_45539:1-1446(-)
MQYLLALVALVGAATMLQGCDTDGALDGIQQAFQRLGAVFGSGGSSAAQQSTLPSDGVEIPLAVKSWGNGLRLAISVSPVDSNGRSLPAQELVLDSGSSTLAFCDTSLADQVSPLQLPSYISCNKYNPGGAPTGYWGKFYKGSLLLGDGLQLNSSYYSVMQQQRSMPCEKGFQGIFGIAFKQLDVAFDANSPSFQPFDDSGDSIQCPTQAAADLAPPLMQLLRSSVASGQLGIHWSGREGASEATLYLDKAATSTPYYTHGSQAGQAALGELGWYDISIQQIALSGPAAAWVDFQCNPQGGTSSTCIMDTGTPILSVPRQIYHAVVQLYYQSRLTGQDLGSLTVTLAGASGAPVALEFSLRRLLENGWIKPGTGGVILGLPLWAFYYTVFDVKAGTATFVAKPQEAPETVPEANQPWLLQGEAWELLVNSTRELDIELTPMPENATSEAQAGLLEKIATAVSGNVADGGLRRLEDHEPVHV